MGGVPKKKKKLSKTIISSKAKRVGIFLIFLTCLMAMSMPQTQIFWSQYLCNLIVDTFDISNRYYLM